MSQSLARYAVPVAVFLSGAGGLMYQTVWVRMLTRLLGATTYATATVLVVFMSGLAIGSLIGGRLSKRTKAPLLTYGIVEILIGVTGVLASFVVIDGLAGWYLGVYQSLGDNGNLVLLARVLFVMACLLPPTILMGTTLPFLVAHIQRQGDGLQSLLARLYSINTYGAVCGVLLTGFVLLGTIGETATLCVAAAFNSCSAVIAWLIATRKVEEQSAVASEESKVDATPYPLLIRRIGLIAFFVSGLTALAYEVLWTRLLTPFLYTSIYAFSTMLATFLVGVARGSREAITNKWTNKSPVAAFGMLEVLIAFAAVFGLLCLPFFNELGFALGSLGGIAGVFACGVVVLPVAFFFGLQFPAAVRVCAGDPKDASGTTGWAYAINTLGAIVGSLSAGFLLIPWVGTAGAVLFLAGANLILGLMLLTLSQEGRLQLRNAAIVTVAFIAVIPFLGDPYRKVMASRIVAFYGKDAEIYSYAERTCATTIAAGNKNPFERTLLVNGVGMTLLCSETKIMAHLPMLLAEQPKKMLIICFGMGTTFRSACKHENLQVDVVDIVPDVFNCFEHFHNDASEYRGHPGTRMIVNDGRNHLLMSAEKYDVITIDPAPPVHSAGTVNLYTKEFFELCKSRLSPGGIFCLWLPPDAQRTEICMVMKSYLDVFPHATAWGGLQFPGFYLIAGHRPLPVSPSQREQLFAKLAAIPDMGEWSKDYADPKKLAGTFLLDSEGLGALVKKYHAVTDDKPYTEFPLWRWALGPSSPKPFDANDIRQETNQLAEQPTATDKVTMVTPTVR